jgi:serine O-acetyltransferase
MISSRAELKFYLNADRLALGISRSQPRLFGDDIWKYERILRRYEYALNCLRGPLFWPVRFYWRWRYYKFGIRLNFEIPPNVAGPGLSLAHRGPVIINPATRIGENCRIHSCVNIGTAAGKQRDAPSIGDDVYIGPGAKIFGPIRIADRIAIAAQAVVAHSFEQPDITVGGIPAKKLSDKGASDYIIRGSQLAAKAQAQ